MTKYILLIISFIMVSYYHLNSTYKSESIIATKVKTANVIENAANTLNKIYFDKDFTKKFYDSKHFETDKNYLQIKGILKNRKGLIIVNKNLDFVSDDINNINFVFISLEDNKLELSDINKWEYLLRVKSSNKINPIVSGDKEYFKFVKEWSSMLTENVSSKKYLYFPLYSLSKNTLLDSSNFVYIVYNMTVDEIKIFNNTNSINLQDNHLWKNQETVTINEIRNAIN